MKTQRILLAALVLSLVALPVAYAKTTPSHGVAVHGTVANLNDSAKTFSVQPKTGAKVDLSWNGATKVEHGPLKDGEMAAVRYMTRDGKNVATVINIAPPAKAAAAATTTSTTAAKTATKTPAKVH